MDILLGAYVIRPRYEHRFRETRKLEKPAEAPDTRQDLRPLRCGNEILDTTLGLRRGVEIHPGILISRPRSLLLHRHQPTSRASLSIISSWIGIGDSPVKHARHDFCLEIPVALMRPSTLR